MHTELPGYRNDDMKVYPYPGYCATVLEESHNFRVRVYEDLTQLPEVLGTGTDVLQNVQKFWVFWHRRT